MIAFVEGEVVSIDADSAVVQAGGVGYRVFSGPGTLSTLHEGEKSRLYTHQVVRVQARVSPSRRPVSVPGPQKMR